VPEKAGAGAPVISLRLRFIIKRHSHSGVYIFLLLQMIRKLQGVLPLWCCDEFV